MNNLGNKKIMGDNISYYMKLNNKTRIDLSNDLNIPYTTITDWINGNKYPRIDKIETLANYFRIEKSNLVEERKIDDVVPVEIIYDDYFPLPYYKNLSAGSFDDIIPPDDADAVVYVPIRFQRRKKRLVAFKINGTSMNNVIPDKSIVVFEKVETYKNNDIVVAERDGVCTIKRFFKKDGVVMLIPDSDDKSHLPIVITSDDTLKIYGKVLWYCPADDVLD